MVPSVAGCSHRRPDAILVHSANQSASPRGGVPHTVGLHARVHGYRACHLDPGFGADRPAPAASVGLPVARACAPPTPCTVGAQLPDRPTPSGLCGRIDGIAGVLGAWRFSMPAKTMGTTTTRRAVTRRTLLKTVGVGLGAISLAPLLSACGMIPGMGGDKLTVWTDATFAPPSDDYQTEEIQKWAKSKNIEVEVTREAGDAVQQKLQAAIESKQLPDISQVNDGRYTAVLRLRHLRRRQRPVRRVRQGLGRLLQARRAACDQGRQAVDAAVLARQQPDAVPQGHPRRGRRQGDAEDLGRAVRRRQEAPDAAEHLRRRLPVQQGRHRRRGHLPPDDAELRRRRS